MAMSWEFELNDIATIHDLADRPRRVRARRGEGERLRDEILDAAEKLLVETEDADEVSIRAISQMVGVTAPSIYRHFEDKDALVVAACQRAYGRFDDYMEAAVADAPDALHNLKGRALAYVRFALENPGQYRVLFMSSKTHSHTLGSEHQYAFDPDRSEIQALVHLVQAVQRAQDEGLLELHATPMEMAVMLWSIVHGMASLRIAQPEMPWPEPEQQVDQMFHVMAFGLCPQSVRDQLRG